LGLVPILTMLVAFDLSDGETPRGKWVRGAPRAAGDAAWKASKAAGNAGWKASKAAGNAGLEASKAAANAAARAAARAASAGARKAQEAFNDWMEERARARRQQEATEAAEAAQRRDAEQRANEEAAASAATSAAIAAAQNWYNAAKEWKDAAQPAAESARTAATNAEESKAALGAGVRLSEATMTRIMLWWNKLDELSKLVTTKKDATNPLERTAIHLNGWSYAYDWMFRARAEGQEAKITTRSLKNALRRLETLIKAEAEVERAENDAELQRLAAEQAVEDARKQAQMDQIAKRLQQQAAVAERLRQNRMAEEQQAAEAAHAAEAARAAAETPEAIARRAAEEAAEAAAAAPLPADGRNTVWSFAQAIAGWKILVKKKMDAFETERGRPPTNSEVKDMTLSLASLKNSLERNKVLKEKLGFFPNMKINEDEGVRNRDYLARIKHKLGQQPGATGGNITYAMWASMVGAGKTRINTLKEVEIARAVMSYCCVALDHVFMGPLHA